MKKNFGNLFGRNCDEMAELLFRYLADCRSPPENQFFTQNR